jgi:ferredoxin
VCAELAPDVIMVGPDGLAEIRTGLTDNPAVLEAADSCPMAAITVAVEEAA